MVKTSLMKILIVDDTEDEVLLMRHVLLRIDPEIELQVAYSGEEGLELLREGKALPSLVLLDLKMPGMGGIDLLRRIRADKRLNNLSVIVVTNSTLEADKRESFASGADGFLCKGCNVDQFQKDIAAALKKNRRLRN